MDHDFENELPLHPRELISLFGDESLFFRQVRPALGAELPPDVKMLLEHNDHMTDAMEQFHGAPVSVSVVAVNQRHDGYSRMSLLSRDSDGRIVQLGMVRLYWAKLPPVVRAEMERAEIPLGRILRDCNVLRVVQFEALWQFQPTAHVADLVQLPAITTLFGRTARIRVDDSPAIDLLEIVVALESLRDGMGLNPTDDRC